MKIILHRYLTRSEATMTQQVTALTGTLNAVADHLRNHANEAAGAVVVAAQQAVGKPSRNLEMISDLLKRLVVQDFAGAKEKLNVLRQNLPERGIGAEAVSGLAKVIQAEQTRFAEQLQKTVRDIGESLNKGDIARAQKTVEAAQKSSTNPNAALTAVTEFMKRLQAQDFTGAEKHLNTLRQHLPEGDIGAEVVSTLEKSVRAEQARLSELIQNAVRDIGAHINKGDIVRAQKVVEMARTSFASPNATLTAVAEFVRRVQVQDFIGAESFLKTIPKTLPDGRILQDISPHSP